MPEPSAPSRAHAPARRRRWPAVLLVVLAALAAGWWWGVPYLVGTMLKTQLRAAGFPDAQVGTVAVAFDRIEVLGLRFGNGSIGSIDVPVATATFRAGDLFGARIDTLVLERPVWSLAPKATGPADVVAAEREVQRALPELPLRRLEVHDARITPAAASGFGAGAIDVTFTADGPRWQLVAAADVGEHRLRATAQLLVGATLASGDVEVQVVGPRPLVLAGPCRVELLSAERVLDLELARAADPFDVALGDRGWTGSGGVALRARVPAGHLDAARVEVALDEFSFGATGGLQVDGLSGDVVLTGLPRPVSDGPQLLRWQGLRFAKIQAGSGEARLELRHDLELSAHVRQMASDEVGSIEVRGVRLAPGVSSLPATIAFDRVSLQEWLELLSKGRVTGDGRLTGSVDVVVHTEPQLELDL